MFSTAQVTSPDLAAWSLGVGSIEAPSQWDVGAWGLAASVGFGLLGCWFSRQTATREAARERSRHEHRGQLLRFVAEVLKLEKTGLALTDAIRRNDAGQLEAVTRYWQVVATNVRALARKPLGFDVRRADELLRRIAAAQTQCELSRVAIERGKTAVDATLEFHRSAARVTHVATELRGAAEQMLDGS